MHYWRNKKHEDLLAVASAIEGDRHLHLYAQYCLLREKGLRKQAFAELEKFIDYALGWTLDKRYQFVDSLSLIQENNSNLFDLFPHPLYKSIVEPTLIDWVAANPSDPSGYRWIGGRDNWRKAISLDSGEQIARARLVRHTIQGAYFSTHHLPEYYIGSPSKDLLYLGEACGLLDGLESERDRMKYSDEVEDCRDLIQTYRDYRKSSYVGSFEAWAGLYNRRCS